MGIKAILRDEVARLQREVVSLKQLLHNTQESLGWHHKRNGELTEKLRATERELARLHCTSELVAAETARDNALKMVSKLVEENKRLRGVR